MTKCSHIACDCIKAKLAKLERYEKALAFYADSKNYLPTEQKLELPDYPMTLLRSNVAWDGGETATAVLRETP